MTIDNFESIIPYITFNREDELFLFIQIVRRAKDHKPDKVREGLIASYYIRDREQLESLKEEIITLCKLYKARAYINLSPKSFDMLQKQLMYDLAYYNSVDVIRLPKKLLHSVTGRLTSKDSHWVIDIDIEEDKDQVIKWLKDNNWYLCSEIPTVSCCHLITTPFNLQAFKEAFPTIDVHKNSMGTLLYYSDYENN